MALTATERRTLFRQLAELQAELEELRERTAQVAAQVRSSGSVDEWPRSA